MRKISFILIGFSALSLSACGTWLDQQQPQVNVQMREDNGDVVVPLPVVSRTEKSIYVVSNSSVDILDFDNMDSSMPAAQDSFGYGGGVLAADSSVTIFPLDADVSLLSQSYGVAPSAQMQPAYNTQTAYGSAEGQIFFKHGSSRLGSGDLNKLSNVAEQARFAPVSRVTVEGYASHPTQVGSQSVESHILNLKESMNRSFAVSKTLMQKGVPAEKLKTVSWGSTKARGNESQDRRVDITMGER
jgi:outer membrane protein OmpA-like peptidoglycan-associated protein